MGAPQIIYIVLLTISLTFALVKDGEKRDVSFGWSLVGSAIAIGLLYWGGFFG